MSEYKEFFSQIEDAKREYETGTITISDDIEWPMRKTVRQITHYIFSRYLEGGNDNLDPATGQRRPFRNVGNAIVDLEWRAKNIDRKSIEAHATDGDHIFSLIVNKELQQWMKDNNFGKTIDDYQRKKSEYGSVLLKKTETADKLLIEPCKWEHTIVDPRDIASGMKIEQHFLTPLELKKKKGVWTEEHDGEPAIDAAITAAKRNKGDKDSRRIEVLDIEGEFEAHVLDATLEEGTAGYDDIKLYNVIAAIVGKKRFVLYKTELKESRFKHDARKTVEGRDFGVGVWEEVFEPQIWINENVIDEREAMSLGGKVVITTNKKNTPSGLTIRNGEVVELEADEFFKPVSLAPQTLPMYQNTVDAWFANMQRDQSAFNGVTGEEPKASTPGISLQLQAAQAGSIFNKRRDQDGYCILDVLKDWVLKFNVKQINKDHTLTASYSAEELRQLDEAIIEWHAMDKAKGYILSPDFSKPTSVPPSESDIQGYRDQKRAELGKSGNKRTLFIPKGYITLERINKKVRFDITDEMFDDQRQLNALAVTLQGMAPNDPARAGVIAQMMEIQGLSSATYPVSQAAPQTPAASVPKAQNTNVNSVLPDGQKA